MPGGVWLQIRRMQWEEELLTADKNMYSRHTLSFLERVHKAYGTRGFVKYAGGGVVLMQCGTVHPSCQIAELF